MKYLKKISLCALSLLLLTACIKNAVPPLEPGEPSGNLGDCIPLNDRSIQISIQEAYVSPPARVSLLLKLDKSDGSLLPILSPDAFTIYERGRNDDCPKQISTLESNAAIAPKSQVFRYNTLLVMDLSGSVIGESFEQLKLASQGFIENVMPDTPHVSYQMGVWWFDGENALHSLCGFTSDKTELLQKLESLNASISTDPSTDLYGAIIKSATIASELMDLHEAENIISASSIVLFTDGTDQAARHAKTEALEKVNTADENISFFTIGLGEEIDNEVLSTVGKDGSIFISHKDELEEIFIETAELVRAKANSFYLFEYCSPKRDGSGINELTISVEVDSLQGVIQTTFDATGFESGCN